MYTVMIVDDERPARELLKMMAHWEEAGFELICEASNGQEALELWNELRPDLIITDIQMPVMDGLAFIEAVRKQSNDQRFVILSCYESFNYARKALQLGVLDYLIKDALDAESLHSLLLRIASDLGSDGEGVANEYEMALPPGQLINSANISMITEEMLFKLQDIYQNVSTIFYALHILLEGWQSPTPAQASVFVSAVQSALDSDNCGYAQYLSEDVIFAVASMDASQSQLEQYYIRYKAAQCIRKALKSHGVAEVTIGLSRPFDSLQDLHSKYIEAQHAAGYRLFYGSGKTLYYDDLHDRSRTVQTEVLHKRLNRIKTLMEANEQEALCKEITNLYDQDLSGVAQLNYISFVNSHLIELLADESVKREVTWAQISNEESPQEILFRCETTSELRDMFVLAFKHLLNADAPKHYSPRIQKVITYILENYTKEISLSDVAQLFSIHKVHLSRTYKEETGMSVNEHILILRIEKSKVLLQTTDYRIGEIIRMVGFQNPQSFYSLFKKFTGVSPSDFRLNK